MSALEVPVRRRSARRALAGLFGVTLLSGTAIAVAPGPAVAAPPTDPPAVSEPAAHPDELPDVMETARRDKRAAALNLVLNGRATAERRGTSTVVKVPGQRTGRADRYVELARERTDKIFVVLAEFGNTRHPDYPDQDTDPDTPGPTRFDGPLHNEIPAPNRAVDNSTIWQADYDRQHYQDLYFGTGNGVESLKTYYEKQSSGRYSVDGLVTDWVKVQYNEARYGRSGGFPCASQVCGNTHNLIQDAVNVWVDGQRAAGRTDEQIRADLASFDQWDRFDHDSDGDFNEADGYIDHFQIVHSGGDEADGDPYQAEDAIWSHRWAAFPNFTSGPEYNRLGGTQIGSTGLWVRDYTIQPENGGLGVFAHEYAHDLGLPDLYDTSGAGGQAENPVNWWSLMGQPRVNAPGDQGIGTRAQDLNEWDKLQLGWYDYEIVRAGQKKTLDLGPHEYNSRKAQGVVVVLPKKQVVTELGAPVEGTRQWWSGQGDNLNNSMTRSLTLPAGPASLTFQAAWNIEDCGEDACDYAYVEVDAGDGFTAIAGTITNPAEGNGIDGTSAGWQPATFDLSAYAGRTISLRLRYVTDGGAGGVGFRVDDLRVTAGSTVFADGAENGTNGWTTNGFSAQGASVTAEFDNYYIASHRKHVSYDRYLKTGPYHFGFNPDQPDKVENFPYQEGLLVWYWDTSQRNNNTSQHPGQGLILPVDAHPDLVYKLDGQPWRPRVQGYDAPFSLRRADSFSLHHNGQSNYVRGQNAVSTFDDTRDHYREDVEGGVRYGVKLPGRGVKIRVVSVDGTSMRIRIT
jgi:immune inhibitor A